MMWIVDFWIGRISRKQRSLKFPPEKGVVRRSFIADAFGPKTNKTYQDLQKGPFWRLLAT